MAKKASRHEEDRYRLKGAGGYVEGEWSFYDIYTSDGRAVVGIVSQRSGGGWIATIPVFGVKDNGIADVLVKVGVAYGRGETPAEAVSNADRRALEGVTGPDDFIQESF
jgi:hypothetical protein